MSKVKDEIIDEQNEFDDTDYGYQEGVKPMEETKSQTNGLPESPASVNTRMKSPNGFVYQWTMRDEKNSNLFYKIREMEKHWLGAGFTPVEDRKSSFPIKPKDYVENRNCPQCGSRLVKSVTRTGKHLIKCETNKWNAMTKQAEGCPFTEWPEDTQTNNGNARTPSGPTMSDWDY